MPIKFAHDLKTFGDGGTSDWRLFSSEARSGVHASARGGLDPLHADFRPGMAIEEAKRLLQTQDTILKGFPEVERVIGKAT